MGEIRVQKAVELGRVSKSGEIEEGFGELAARGEVAVWLKILR